MCLCLSLALSHEGQGSVCNPHLLSNMKSPRKWKQLISPWNPRIIWMDPIHYNAHCWEPRNWFKRQKLGNEREKETLKFTKCMNTAREGAGWLLGWKAEGKSLCWATLASFWKGGLWGRSWAGLQLVSYVALLLLLNKILSSLHISLLSLIESTVLGIFLVVNLKKIRNKPLIFPSFNKGRFAGSVAWSHFLWN